MFDLINTYNRIRSNSEVTRRQRWSLWLEDPKTQRSGLWQTKPRSLHGKWLILWNSQPVQYSPSLWKADEELNRNFNPTSNHMNCGSILQKSEQTRQEETRSIWCYGYIQIPLAKSFIIARKYWTVERNPLTLDKSSYACLTEINTTLNWIYLAGENPFQVCYKVYGQIESQPSCPSLLPSFSPFGQVRFHHLYYSWFIPSSINASISTNIILRILLCQTSTS